MRLGVVAMVGVGGESSDGGPGGRWRLFVAIDLGEGARAALVAAQRACHGLALPVRWVDPQGAHLTLKFLGDTEVGRVGALAATLRAVAAGQRPFDLRTGGLGAFPNARRPRVLWLGLTGDLERLARLQRAVEVALGELGFPPEVRPFRPHLTLGRPREGTRPGGADDLTAAIAASSRWPAAPLPVDAVRLMRSKLGPGGARYTCLAVAPLGEPAGEAAGDESSMDLPAGE